MASKTRFDRKLTSTFYVPNRAVKSLLSCCEIFIKALINRAYKLQLTTKLWTLYFFFRKIGNVTKSFFVHNLIRKQPNTPMIELSVPYELHIKSYNFLNNIYCSLINWLNLNLQTCHPLSC